MPCASYAADAHADLEHANERATNAALAEAAKRLKGQPWPLNVTICQTPDFHMKLLA